MTTKLRTQTAAPNQSDRILRPRQLADRFGLSLATLWRLRRRGDLPEPIRLSPGCVGWRTSEIDAWLTARAERRR
jgi:prophage regulatory protein